MFFKCKVLVCSFKWKGFWYGDKVSTFLLLKTTYARDYSHFFLPLRLQNQLFNSPSELDVIKKPPSPD